MNDQNERAEALFDQMEETRQKRRRSRRKKIIIGLVAVAAVLVAGFLYIRSQVTARFGGTDAEVLSYEAARTTISSTVSGSGSLTAVDTESIVLPAGVEVTEVLVRRGQSFTKGDVLATVNMSTVSGALADLQEQLDDLDDQISDAAGDSVSSYVKAGISGRVKLINAAKGDRVSDVMAEHGALAVLSLDGYMALELENDTLAAGDKVTVRRESGKTLTGKVDTALNGTVTILVTDNGPKYGETVTVLDGDGNELGTAALTIHNPLAITGVTGTISGISVSENARVYASGTLFTLKDTAYSANYDTLLRQRQALEETLLDLLQIYRDGAVAAAWDGTVTSVDYDASGWDEDSATALMTLYPNEKMSITLTVDEDDILSLEVGQTAEVTVSSVGDTPFEGTVTEIDRTATTSSGVTYYAATVELYRADGMLAGMTAEVAIRISGADNVIVVPVEAVHNTSNISYVYTAYDEKTGEYGGMTEVVTGLSNDNYIEIVEGLAEGTTVYYTESAADNFFAMMGGMGGGISSGMSGGDMSNMGGGSQRTESNRGGSGGDMPNMSGGGNMPSRGG